MKVKSPPPITGEKTGTMGILTILVWVGRCQSKGTQRGHFKDPLAGEYKFSAPQLVMKVKSPPPITGEKIGTMGGYSLYQCGQGDANQSGLKGDIFKDPLAGEYKFSAPQLVMKVKSPPPITGEKIGTMGGYSLYQCGKGDTSQMGLILRVCQEWGYISSL